MAGRNTVSVFGEGTSLRMRSKRQTTGDCCAVMEVVWSRQVGYFHTLQDDV